MTYTPTDEQASALASDHFRIIEGDRLPDVGHYAHHLGVVRSLAALPAFQAIIREERRLAWEEGFDAGERDAFAHETFDEPCITNPYGVPPAPEPVEHKMRVSRWTETGGNVRARSECSCGWKSPESSMKREQSYRYSHLRQSKSV